MGAFFVTVNEAGGERDVCEPIRCGQTTVRMNSGFKSLELHMVLSYVVVFLSSGFHFYIFLLFGAKCEYVHF